MRFRVSALAVAAPLCTPPPAPAHVVRPHDRVEPGSFTRCTALAARTGRRIAPALLAWGRR
jgi:hypothetical protein